MHGNLLVLRGEELLVIWYSYGRVYTVVNAEECNPKPEDAGLIAAAFLALEAHFKKMKIVEGGQAGNGAVC